MMIVKIVSTVVFFIFCVFAGHATYELGLGLYGIPLALLAMAAMMWEVWVQPVRDEAFRQELLKGIDEWNFEPSTSNISDAKETVRVLQDRIDYVTDAYTALKAEQEEG